MKVERMTQVCWSFQPLESNSELEVLLLSSNIFDDVGSVKAVRAMKACKLRQINHRDSVNFTHCLKLGSVGRENMALKTRKKGTRGCHRVSIWECVLSTKTRTPGALRKKTKTDVLSAEEQGEDERRASLRLDARKRTAQPAPASSPPLQDTHTSFARGINDKKVCRNQRCSSPLACARTTYTHVTGVGWGDEEREDG